MKRILLYFLVISGTCFPQQWESLGGGSDNYQIRNIWIDTLSDEIYVSGDFTSIGGVPSGGVAKWDGTNWVDMCAECSNHQIFSVLKYHDTLHIAGSFRLSGITKHVAHLTSNGWVSIADVDQGCRLQVLGDSLLLLGAGDSINGVYMPEIALRDNNNWRAPFQGNDFFDHSFFHDISKLIKYNDIHILGGNFSADSLKELAWYDNGYWRPLGGGVPGDASIEEMIVYKDVLYLGGNIHDEDGNPSDYLMAWNGREFFNPFPNVQFTYNVRDFQIINDELYIVSLYNYVGDPTTYFFAKFDGENFCSFGGSFPSIFDINTSPPNHIRELNGELYVVCSSMLFNDTVNNIAHWLGTEMDTCIVSPVSTIQEMDFNTLQIYPNPTHNGFITIELSSKKLPAEFEVRDLIGNQVFTFKINSNSENVDLSQLANGPYFVRTMNDAGLGVNKIVIIAK